MRRCTDCLPRHATLSMVVHAMIEKDGCNAAPDSVLHPHAHAHARLMFLCAAHAVMNGAAVSPAAFLFKNLLPVCHLS